MYAYHMIWCSITINKDELTETSLRLSEQFGNIDSHQLCLENIPSTDFRSPGKEELYQMDANGFTQIEVTFQPKGPRLEVPVGARPESFGGEYNCLFGDKQTHCCTPYTRAGPLDKEAPEEHIRHPLPCNGSGSAGHIL
ncbi:uncharacterized protein LOC126700122 [Quercus robur]|uniref:uncharacterized protein LOC126700122 n=1 Tax=Quercus robur TaxID=38942 RepID=UPI00216275F5|nr:uncharacterized protein LOC126700122 [Quercus robur]